MSPEHYMYIIYDAPKYDIICTENSDVIDSFISEILKHESSVIVSFGITVQSM